MAILTLNDTDYFTRPELSASQCKMLLQPGGPARFAWYREHPQEHRRTFDVGHAAHTLALGVGAPIEAIPADLLSRDGRASTAAAKEWIAEARDRGVTPLTPTDHRLVQDMTGALLDHPVARDLLRREGARAEVVLTAEIDGVPFRGKLDQVADAGALDYKTTGKLADPDTFARTVHTYCYDVQAAAYLQLMQLNGWQEPGFTFVVQEKTPPYLPAVYVLDDLFMDIGRDRLRQAIATYVACTRSGQWPGYPNEITEIIPPAWAFDDEDMEIV